MISLGDDSVELGQLTSRFSLRVRNASTKHLHISGFRVSFRSAMMLFVSFMFSSRFFIRCLQFLRKGPSQGNRLYICNEAQQTIVGFNIIFVVNQQWVITFWDISHKLCKLALLNSVGITKFNKMEHGSVQCVPVCACVNNSNRFLM